MGLLTRFKAGHRAEDLIDRIERAEGLPLEEMEELIVLCRGYAAAREKLFERKMDGWSTLLRS